MKVDKKPKIQFDNYYKRFYCRSTEVAPGYLWFLLGSGLTPKDAYQDWKVARDGARNLVHPNTP